MLGLEDGRPKSSVQGAWKSEGWVSTEGYCPHYFLFQGCCEGRVNEVGTTHRRCVNTPKCKPGGIPPTSPSMALPIPAAQTSISAGEGSSQLPRLSQCAKPVSVSLTLLLCFDHLQPFHISIPLSGVARRCGLAQFGCHFLGTVCVC